jgi:hypothetical protein
MSAPGLDKRVNQHARRAGLMVGISMALTIAVCIGSFVWIYAKVDPLTRDFVDQATAAPTKKAAVADNSDKSNDAADTPVVDANTGGGDVQEANPTEKPEPTATSRSFNATHRMIAEVPVNLRPGPGVNSGDPVGLVAPGDELQYLNGREQGSDSGGGELIWLKFRTEDGLEGWIREVDVEPLNSGQ